MPTSYKVFAAVMDGKIVSVPLDFEGETISQLSVFPTREEADKTGYDPSILKEITVTVD